MVALFPFFQVIKGRSIKFALITFCCRQIDDYSKVGMFKPLQEKIVQKLLRISRFDSEVRCLVNQEIKKIAINNSYFRI